MSDKSKFPNGPEPIPILTGKAAKEFLKRVQQGPTEKQKQFMKEAEKAYWEIKQK